MENRLFCWFIYFFISRQDGVKCRPLHWLHWCFQFEVNDTYNRLLLSSSGSNIYDLLTRMNFWVKICLWFHLNLKLMSEQSAMKFTRDSAKSKFCTICFFVLCPISEKCMLRVSNLSAIEYMILIYSILVLWHRECRSRWSVLGDTCLVTS